MRYQSLIITSLLIISCATLATAQLKTVKVNSPDNSLVFTISVNNGSATYNITRKQMPVIAASALGLTVNKSQLDKNAAITIVGRKLVNETYATRGVHSLAINKYNLLKVKITGLKPYQFEVKMFNNGAAFRYVIINHGKAVVNSEETFFNIPAGSTIWSQPNIKDYQGKYTEQKIEDAAIGLIAGPPLTIKLPGNMGYAAISEGGLTDFSGMYLTLNDDRAFKTTLADTVIKTGLIETPWRVIMISPDLNELVNNDIVSNVSPPADPELFPKGYATDWIKPGKGVWSWLSGRNESVNFENMKRFCDQAAELGIENNLVDAGWVKWKDGNKDNWDMLAELVTYAKTKGVKIWVWKSYPDKPDAAGIKSTEQRQAFFKRCAAIGVTGLKLDWFNSESQDVIDYYQAALKDAAKLHLMIDFHGADKPTGQSRTWPNEMTREGIRGLEANTSWPKHNTTLLFTRFLAGHGDYTPLTFTDIAKGTTLTHQVATVAAFTSPFMCLGVVPDDLLKSDVKTIVKDMPVVWDETIVLPPSEIGQLAIFAKRNGKVWYLTALNGETAQAVKVQLGFLGTGTYTGTLLQDIADEPSKTNITTARYNKLNSIEIKMPAGGGFLGCFKIK